MRVIGGEAVRLGDAMDELGRRAYHFRGRLVKIQ